MLSGGVDLPHPLPQPSGCRADTQIACPGSNHRICNVQKCDGTEDCPKMTGEDRSWDEVVGCAPDTTTPRTTILTTNTAIMTTTTLIETTTTTIGKTTINSSLVPTVQNNCNKSNNPLIFHKIITNSSLFGITPQSCLAI